MYESALSSFPSTLYFRPQMSLFPEEPLNLTAGEGFGYFPSYPGQKLNNDQYEITRKLGYGPRSSVWMALKPQYVNFTGPFKSDMFGS